MNLQEVQHSFEYNAVAHLDMITQTGNAKYRYGVNSSTNEHKYAVPRLSYEDTTQIMERKFAH